MEANAASIGYGRLAIGRRTAYRKTRNASDQRQQPLELRRHGHCHAIAQRRYLIPHALEGIAEPTTVNNQPPGDGGALRLISVKTNIHGNVFIFIFYKLFACMKNSLYLCSR
jgi:hypothetical protein